MFQDSVHVTFPNGIADTKSKVAFYSKYYSKRLAMKVMALYAEVCGVIRCIAMEVFGFSYWSICEQDYELFQQYLQIPDWVAYL